MSPDTALPHWSCMALDAHGGYKMPVTDGHIDYEIPDDIKGRIPEHFYIAMAGELFSVYGPEAFDLINGYNVDGNSYEYYDLDTGTGGWIEAFKATCRKLGMEWLIEYHASLDWYDADLFDGEIETALLGLVHGEEFKKDHCNAYYRYLCTKEDADGK